MAGKEIKPMAMTVAPTIPVLAARRAPTMTTDRPNPLFIRPKSFAIEVNRSSATFDFSMMTPMKMKSGTAIKVALVMTPYKRFGMVSKRYKSKPPNKETMAAKIRETPAKVKATGNPAKRIKQTRANNNKGNTYRSSKYFNIIAALCIIKRIAKTNNMDFKT